MLSKPTTIPEALTQLQTFERQLQACKNIYDRLQNIPGLEDILEQIYQQCQVLSGIIHNFPKKIKHKMRLSPDISDNIAKTVKKEPMDSEYELESREL